MAEEEINTHPAAVVVQFVRFQGTLGRMFGSPLREHNGAVALRIRNARWSNEDGVQRTWGTSTPFVEVWLTPLQFAELLTTMNQESGVPATLYTLNGELVEKWKSSDDQADVVKIRDQFVARTRDFIVGLKRRRGELDDLLAGSRVPKAIVEQLKNFMGSVIMEVESNRPYAVQVFEEALQKVKANLAAQGYNNALTSGGEPPPAQLPEGEDDHHT